MKNKLPYLWLSVFFAISLFSITSTAQRIVYEDNWGKAGFTLQENRTQGVKILYSVEEFMMIDQDIRGEAMKTLLLPGHFLPNNAGAPNLPGDGRMIAIPHGAKAVLNIRAIRTETYTDINLSPAFKIPVDSDDSPLYYEKDMSIYSKNAFYPENNIILSGLRKVRGVDYVILGITPFQYNPVTKELIVYRDIEVEVVFEGGNGHIGEDRLRSPWWDPMLHDMFINHASLPVVEYPNTRRSSRETGCEYLIITPTAPYFQAWADSLRKFRTIQGILTDVVTLDDVGGNTTQAIENYVNNAYNNWDIPPAAVLLMADYGTDPSNSIIAPIWDSYCASDHIYADVDNDDQADIVFARMTAQNENHCQIMVEKILDYERQPPTNPHYYDHPITAMGWQTERWFQICAEVVNGFWTNEHNKEPKHENAIYSGSPGSTWSSNPNTYMVVNYFGPNGLGYIPETSAYLTDWGGNATRINNDINSGAFMMVHRDHGSESGWGEPDYQTSDLSNLSNSDLIHVFSINCLTGKYNWSGECFTEAFHRYPQRALSVTAASETSYSFVNDTYLWGMIDYLWPEFMPDYDDPFPMQRGVLPAFGNVYGKYFLEQSDWPYNPGDKDVTYFLFHHHGGAFSTVYTEMPQDLDIVHDGFLIPMQNYYTVQANDGALVCLSINGEIIGTGWATGEPTNITIEPQPGGTSCEITITLQDYYRFTQHIMAAGPPYPPQSPDPYDGKTNTKVYTPLFWENGYGSFTNSYKIYIGTDNPPTNFVNGVETTEPEFYLPGHLEHNTTYYWRVDAFNQFGSITGNVWSFTTKMPPDENFETGDFSTNMWQMSGDASWEVVNNMAFDGTFSAKSGTIGSGESTSLILQLDVDAMFFVPISFWKSVSTDPNDKLKFYIDGELKDQWGGLSSFGEEIFTIGDGLHTFEWRYVKDSVNSFGDDAVWIDYIYFPPLKPPTANAGEDATICEGTTYTCQGLATNCISVLWETSGTGTFDDNTLMCPDYIPSDEDILLGSVTLTLNAFTKGEDIISDDMVLSFDPLPYMPGIPEGPDYVDLYYSSTSEYTTSGSSNSDSYIWDLMPEYAGIIEGESTSAIVTWDISFLGAALVKVKGMNDCGEGPFSEDYGVTVDNTVGFNAWETSDVAVRILPNPNNGQFLLEIKTNNTETIRIRLINTLGEEVYKLQNLQADNLFAIPIDLNEHGEGLYLLLVEGKDARLIKKVIVQK